MAERPWVTPEELKEYTEFEEVKNRADSKLKIDISRAESSIIDVGKLGVESLLDDYVVVQPLNGVTMRLRSL